MSSICAESELGFDCRIKHKRTKMVCKKCYKTFEFLFPLILCPYCGNMLRVVDDYVCLWNSYSEIIYTNNRILRSLLITVIKYKIKMLYDDYLHNNRIDFEKIMYLYILSTYLDIFYEELIRECRLLQYIAKQIAKDNYKFVGLLQCNRTIEALKNEVKKSGMFVINF